MKIHPERDPFILKGTVKHIGEILHIKRVGIPDLLKKTLTIETPDGQVLFPEIRNSKLSLLEEHNIRIGSTVEIEYLFQGSTKDSKRYNNIYIYSIKNI